MKKLAPQGLYSLKGFIKRFLRSRGPRPWKEQEVPDKGIRPEGFIKYIYYIL